MALTACGGGSSSSDGVIAPMSAAAPAAPARLGRGETLRARSGASPVARALVLSDPARERPAALPTAAASGPVPQRVGFARSVAASADAGAVAKQTHIQTQTQTQTQTQAQGQWQWQWSALPDGRHIAALSLTSPQAQGLRLGLLVQRSAMAQEIAAVDVLDALQRNRAAGVTGEAADTYWAPLVEGPEATLEIELPAHVAPGDVQVSLPSLSHLDALPSIDSAAAGAVLPKIGESDSCQVDVSCDATYLSESKSVARLLFVKDGDSYLCSGALLNDKASSGTPYLLTANHCISSQAVASSLQSFWFYRSAQCNANVLSPQSRTLTGGATLLYASATTDTSFMRLNNTPPEGAVFAGWTPQAPATSDPVFGLHHPQGDLQKISTGFIDSYEQCRTSAFSGGLTCTTSGQAASQFVNVRYLTGATEGGSSGSPLFRRVGGTSYVTGQLYGGSNSCQDRSGSNVYGRFDVAYAAALQTWLDLPAQRAPVYRFYNSATGAHFYTRDAAERDFVIATYRSFAYEGTSFFAFETQAAGTSPVYRFFNVETSAHFYTINQAERDYVLQAYPQFHYEGISWYALVAPGQGAAPLYRFYRRPGSTHFYTASAEERAFVNATYPSFTDEGTAYYIWSGY